MCIAFGQTFEPNLSPFLTLPSAYSFSIFPSPFICSILLFLHYRLLGGKEGEKTMETPKKNFLGGEISMCMVMHWDEMGHLWRFSTFPKSFPVKERAGLTAR